MSGNGGENLGNLAYWRQGRKGARGLERRIQRLHHERNKEFKARQNPITESGF